jgi:hypothetical protein
LVSNLFAGIGLSRETESRYRLSEGSGAAKLLYFKPLFNEPSALWTFAPKTLQHRSRGAQTNSGSVSTTNRLTIIFGFIGVVKKMRVFPKSQMKIDLL